jgi:hypothetical protein
MGFFFFFFKDFTLLWGGGVVGKKKFRRVKGNFVSLGFWAGWTGFIQKCLTFGTVTDG